MSATPLAEMMNVGDVISSFRDAMLDQDIDVRGEIIADGTLHRYHVEGDTRGSRNAWAILHIDERPAGMFGCNKRHGDHKFNWQSSQKTAPLTPEEKKAYAERVAKDRADKDAAEKARYEKAAKIANSVWENAAEVSDDHPYLQSKGIKAHGLKSAKWFKVNAETGKASLISDNALLVPITDRKRKIHSLQAIFPTKNKIHGG